MSAILDCKLRPSWAKSQMGQDRFETGIPKLPKKNAFIIHLNNPIIYVL